MLSQVVTRNQRAIIVSSPRCTAARLLFLLLLLFYMFSVCDSTSCFECSSLNETYCPEMMTDDDEGIITYNSCSYIHEGRFCVKAVGIIGGSLGTRRFCSSRDLGNYCEYIRRPGDQREYRSCVYTCTGDGCNGTGRPSQPNLWLVAASVLSIAYFRQISSSTVFNVAKLSTARSSFMTTPVIR